MRTLTFHGPSLNEAIADVRAQLGADAVILSWARSDTGVVLTVSTSAPDKSVAKAQRPEDHEFDAWNSVARRKSTAPRHDVFAGETPLQQPKAKPIEPTATELLKKPVSPPRKVTPAALIRPPKATLPSQPSTKPSPPKLTPAQPTPPPSPLAALLTKAGMDSAVVATLKGAHSDTTLRRGLIDLFTDRLSFAPLDALPKAPIALVGPPGCGKSVTVAKLAARALASGASVSLFSCDTGRSGGSAQLEALAQRLGCDFATADHSEALRGLVDQALALGQAVLIDTPAAGAVNPRDVDLVARLCEAARAEPVLCLPADLRHDDAGDLIRAWAYAGATRTIITRLDLTTRKAGVLGALMANDTSTLAVAQVSDTPFIAGGLALATPSRLASMFLEANDLKAVGLA